MSDERTEMLKAAVAACFKARQAVTPANVRKHVPEDFFMDFDSGKPLDDATVFAEIQATYAAKPPKLMIETNPDGHKLGAIAEDFSGDSLPPENEEDDESLRHEWGPATVAMPVLKAAPAKESTAEHVPSGPGQSPQARLNAARRREQDLLGKRPLLLAAQRNAREALAVTVRTYQEHDPHRQTPADVAREFREQSQRDREARAARGARGAYQLTPVEANPRRGEIAYVDLERQYSQGGDANAMARRMNRTGNRRGAYPKSALGQTNHDPSRGPVPAPVAPRQTVPALAK